MTAYAALRRSQPMAKKAPAGEGSRFKAIEAKAKKSGAKNPAAVAAAAGAKKWGKEDMAKMAAAGKKGKIHRPKLGGK